MESLDSMPYEIILYILSLLPFHLVLKLKSVCKDWYSLINDLAQLQLKQAKETSAGIVKCRETHIAGGTISLEIFSLQVRGGFKVLMEKTISGSSPGLILLDSFNGLLCLTDAKLIHVCNPTTGEFVTLPLCDQSHSPPSGMKRSNHGIGFGYCPLRKQHKVVLILRDVYEFNGFKPWESNQGCTIKAAVMTLGSSSKTYTWRIIEGPGYPVEYLTVSLGGTIYWLVTAAWNHLYYGLAIVAFDVGDEKFERINAPPVSEENDHEFGKTLAKQQGRLCLVEFFFPVEEHFVIWIMLEDHQWVKQHTILFTDLYPHQILSELSIDYTCLGEGKLLLTPSMTISERWILYDIKTKAFEPFNSLRGDRPKFDDSFTTFEESLVSVCGG